MIDVLRPLIKKFAVFAKNNLSFNRPPALFLKNDTGNGGCALGKTAHYDPQNSSITLYISNRHPKDIIRSFAHELIHHCQNERGDLSAEKMKTLNKNYAQENDHMRKMEEEAYLQGNMCFRDWEDGLDDKLQYKMKIAEQKFLKENKQMTVKINKKFLKGLITKLLEEKESKSEKIASEESKCAEDCDCEKCEKKRLEEESLDESLPDEHIKEQDEQGTKAVAGKTSLAYPMSVGTDTKEECREGEKIFKGHEEHGCQPNNWNPATASEGKIMNPEDWEKLKLSTPEGAKALYESRFTKKNTRLFEKLLKEWAK